MKGLNWSAVGMLVFVLAVGVVVCNPVEVQAHEHAHPVLRALTIPFWGPVVLVRNARERREARRSCGGATTIRKGCHATAAVAAGCHASAAIGCHSAAVSVEVAAPAVK